MSRRRRVLIALLVPLALLFGGGAFVQVALPMRAPPGPTPGHAGETLAFPKGFLWGVATAGQQIETQQPSDWTAFENDVFAHRRFSAGAALGTTKPGHIRDLGRWSETVRHEKAGFDTHWAEDIATASGLGLNAFRFSIDWARLYPRPGMTAPDPDGVAYYRRIVGELKRRRITPFVTLYHVATPAWLWTPDAAGKRGWERADAQSAWQAYVRAVAETFIPDVQDWCTLNEPMVSLYNGYIDGSYPPLEKRGGEEAAAPVLEAMLKAHASAYRILHEVAAARHAEVNVGLTQAVIHVAPLRNGSLLDRLTAAYVDQAWNWDFLDAVNSGRMRLIGTGIDQEIPGLARTQDYVGLNYYQRLYVASDLKTPSSPRLLNSDPAKVEPVTAMGWTIDPHGFYGVLTKAAHRYRKPIYVLENGAADAAPDDIVRRKYLVEHVRELWLAMHEGGADVRAYMQWSLIDNFEWTDGFDARFGLVAVDYEHGFKRTPRPSAGLYGEIVRANALPESVVKRYQATPYPAHPQ